MASVFPQGLDSFVNPSGSTALGSDVQELKHSVQHQKLNDAMAAVQEHIGVTGSTNPTTVNYRIDQIINESQTSGSFDLKKIQFLSSNGPFEIYGLPSYYKEITYSRVFVNSVIWYTSASKDKKIFEVEYNNRNSKNQATEILYTVYNFDGISIKSKMQDIITYSGPLELNRTRLVIM